MEAGSTVKSIFTEVVQGRDNGGWDEGEGIGGDTEMCLAMRQF